MKKITMSELHNILLNIAKEFHGICVKHDIPYYMLGGTMLGAVRHKGFIPWDDDMDFGVPRQYWEKCLDVLSKELPNKYVMLTIENSSAVLNGCIKISNNQTIINEIFKENNTDEFGINIDIFPLDLTNDKTGIFSKNYRINILNKVQQYLFLSLNERSIKKKIIAYILKFALFKLERKDIIYYIQSKLLQYSGDYIANHYGAWGIKEIIAKNIMGVPSLYHFEDTLFYGVENSDAYLRCLYNDYMQLPPESKRHIHISNMFFK